MMEPEQLFLSFHYPELKELTVTFLTLTSSIFTFSVIFADKLVDTTAKKRRGHIALFSAWGLFIVALILGGTGLLRLVIAADLAHGGMLALTDPFLKGRESFSLYLASVYAQLGLAGTCMVAGLMLLGVAAFYRVFLRRSS